MVQLFCKFQNPANSGLGLISVSLGDFDKQNLPLGAGPKWFLGSKHGLCETLIIVTSAPSVTRT